MACRLCDGVCPVGEGMCHCGCGQPAPLRTTPPIGAPTRWVHGHAVTARTRAALDDTTLSRFELARQRHEAGQCPYCGPDCQVGVGKCHCGCGQDATIIRYSEHRRAQVGGAPRRCLTGHHERKLSDDLVREMRRRYATEPISQDALAAQYGLAQATVSKILRFKQRADAGI